MSIRSRFLRSELLLSPVRLVVAVILLLPLFCGCSGELKTYPVTGKIKFADDSPVMFGTIELQSETHPLNARGKINRDGTFTLGTYSSSDGAVPGKHKVVITQLITNHFHIEVEHDHGEMVSKKYFSYRTTDLVLTVEKKNNEVVLIVEPDDEQ